MIPLTISQIYVGINLQSLTELLNGNRALSTVEIIVAVFSSLAIFLMIFIVSRESKKELGKILRIEEI